MSRIRAPKDKAPILGPYCGAGNPLQLLFRGFGLLGCLVLQVRAVHGLDQTGELCPLVGFLYPENLQVSQDVLQRHWTSTCHPYLPRGCDCLERFEVPPVFPLEAGPLAQGLRLHPCGLVSRLQGLDVFTPLQAPRDVGGQSFPCSASDFRRKASMLSENAWILRRKSFSFRYSRAASCE